MTEQPQQPLTPSAYQRPPKPPLPLWRRRQRLGNWGIIVGAMAIVAGLAIDYGWYNKPVSEINGVCSTQLGQLFAAGHPGIASNCSHAALLDHVLGWLIIAGVLAVIGGVAAGISARHLRAAGAPAAPPAQPFPPQQG